MQLPASPAGSMVRITAADGQVVEDTLPGAEDQAGNEIAGTVQFK